MGLLDRLKGGGSGAGPDALTAEIAGRLRALPTVESAEPVAADRVDVTWTGHGSAQPVDLAGLRPRWKQASGFDRIELVDDFVESLSPEATAGADVPGPGDPTATGPIGAPEAPGRTMEGAAGVPGSEAATAEDQGPGWEQLRTTVLPVLRPAGGGPECVRWSIGGRVEATVVADGVPIAPGDCEQWGVGEVDVRAAATANLREIDPAPEPIGPGARAWVPTAPAGAQSAWLTAPARLLEAIGLDEGVAFAPLSSELVVIDPADTELLRSILVSTEKIVAEQAEPLTAIPFLLTAAGAQPWDPPDDHPLATAVQILRGNG